MPETTLQKLAAFGQSVWLDNISRSLIAGGIIKEMIGQGLRGMTSNPTIFDQAISKSGSYDEKIKELSRAGKSAFEIYDDLTIRDIQEAADIFKPLYDRTNGWDGYVSLEINPQLALQARETVAEGRRLFGKVNRANVMFKVPATAAGFEAIEELLAGGININVTLIFSLGQYLKTTQAFLRGLERLSQKTNDLSGISSVASVFVSRIDTVVDKLLTQRIAQEPDQAIKKTLESLQGKAAVANSKIIFKNYQEIFSAPEFQSLKQKGAKAQRVLWGSTSAKNPAYSDIKYVSELIGKNTVNTMPGNTLEAFLDHGIVEETLTSEAGDAQDSINHLKNFGIDLNQICAKLLEHGVLAFEKSFVSLLQSIEQKAKIVQGEASHSYAKARNLKI